MASEPLPANSKVFLRRRLAESLGWTPASFTLLSTFSAIVMLVMVVWWPLVKDYLSTANPQYSILRQMDWLLVGIFAVMSLLVMSGANLKTDVWIIAVGMVGGLAIESWGTQTHLWNYYTAERPPLWIIPAWPIASLAIDRLTRVLSIAADYARQHLQGLYFQPWVTRKSSLENFYWVVFPVFFVMMAIFVSPTLNKPSTWLSLLLSALLIISRCDRRQAVLIFLAGSGLGYFLEVWGTTRACWTYYTFQTPPVFAVFAHGLASVAFWRSGLLLRQILHKIL